VDWPEVIVAVVLLLFLYAWWLARRIERLNARTAAALDALEDQLRRRATAAAALHGAAAQAAMAAGRPDTDARQAAENDLVRALRRLPAEAAGDADLRAENRRLGVARQVYNDAVRDTRALRSARIPRMFWLGRRDPLPEYFDVDELDLDVIEHHRREAEAVRAAIAPAPRTELRIAPVVAVAPPGLGKPGVGEATAGPS
jgi:hypothetical protein